MHPAGNECCTDEPNSQLCYTGTRGPEGDTGLSGGSRGWDNTEIFEWTAALMGWGNPQLKAGTGMSTAQSVSCSCHWSSWRTFRAGLGTSLPQNCAVDWFLTFKNWAVSHQRCNCVSQQAKCRSAHTAMNLCYSRGLGMNSATLPPQQILHCSLA